MDAFDLQFGFFCCALVQSFHELDQVRCEIFVSISYLMFLEKKINLTNQLLWVPIVHLFMRLPKEVSLHQLTTNLPKSHGIFNKQGKPLDIVPKIVILLPYLLKKPKLFLMLLVLFLPPLTLLLDLSKLSPVVL